jgi:hypothetical protein
MRTNRTAGGILLNGDYWNVAAVSQPPVQRLVKPDKVDKKDYDNILMHPHRGKNRVISTTRVRLVLPE